jgi:Flp pilus assembly protein TadG
MLLVVLALVAWSFLAWLGRLTTASQSIENAAQSAARAASLQDGPDEAQTAAVAAVATFDVIEPCRSAPDVTLSWTPGDTGQWQGGTVTAVVTCAIANPEPFTTEGRTIAASDVQPIDRFAP